MDKATQEASDRLRTYIGWDEQAPEEERLSRPDGYWAPLPIPLVRTLLAALDAARAREARLQDALENALEWAEWLERQRHYTPIMKAHWPDEARAILAETEAEPT